MKENPKVKLMPEDPQHPGLHIDPATGIRPISEWGSHCALGFVRESRFGSGQVIAGTNRDTTRDIRVEGVELVEEERETPTGNCDGGGAR